MIDDKDVCKHCHRIVGEVPKYHCPKSPTGMHEAVEAEAPPPCTNHFDVSHGDSCPRCGKLILRDETGREVDPPEGQSGTVASILASVAQLRNNQQRETKTMKITTEEQQLIALFRRLPDLDQQAILQQANEWVELHKRLKR